MRPAWPVSDDAAFSFWHLDLVTLHVWLWDPDPEGVFNR